MIIDTNEESASKVTALPIRFKSESEERTLYPVESRPCYHQGGFIVDESAAEVTCKICAVKLNAIWVLAQLAHKETKYHLSMERYRDEMARLANRSKTKCQHCHQMTRISRA